jgi:hypothetical protein
MSSASLRSAVRPVLATLLPLAACVLQWLCWPLIAPYVWFLFYPVVFLSSWLGGFLAGIGSACLSTALVWWFFLHPVHALVKPAFSTYLNAAMFLAMGALFSWSHERERRAGRRHTQAKLLERDETLERMSRLAKVGSWSFDVATLKGSWSGEVARIHDLDPSAPVDVQAGLGYYHEEDRPVIAEAVRRCIEEAEAFDLELRLVSAKGVPKWVRTMGNPVLQDGRVVRVHGALEDITGRKQVELEVMRLNATLEGRVAERTRELQGVNQELETFAYAVSHDLRAPLRAMAGFSQALQEDCVGTLPPEGRAHLEHIIQASQRMAGLIDGLLQMSRTTRCDLEPVPVDLSELAGTLLAELARSCPERRVRIQVQPGIRVQGDPRMLEAAMGNLLGNAWKYTSRTPAASITVDTVQEEGQNWIRIADNGSGFDMAYAGKLFQPFQRLHRQDEFPGLGIGLATVQRIVQRHGGQVKAVSAPGQGAVFSMVLPPPEAVDARP